MYDPPITQRLNILHKRGRDIYFIFFVCEQHVFIIASWFCICVILPTPTPAFTVEPKNRTHGERDNHWRIPRRQRRNGGRKNKRHRNSGADGVPKTKNALTGDDHQKHHGRCCCCCHSTRNKQAPPRCKRLVCTCASVMACPRPSASPRSIAAIAFHASAALSRTYR